MSDRGGTEVDWEELVGAAAEGSLRAYAPYSGLRVGAALLAADGRAFTGCNVENSSFGLTVCGERTALVRAVAEGAREFRGLAICTPDAGPLSPCGACRQALAEFCEHLPIVSVGQGGARREFELRDLLPQAFGWPGGEGRSTPQASAEEQYHSPLDEAASGDSSG